MRVSLAGSACMAMAVFALSSARGAEGPAGKLQYNRDIRPIFADTCFKCHGFDKRSRKGDLRLDVADEATIAHKKGTPIVPGNPEASEAYQRLIATDPDRAMPPVDSKLALTAAQKELIRRWIAEGAEYQPHWAFIPVHKPATPDVKEPSAVRNSIDAFVLSRLEAEGLKFAPEADRRTLIRRVSFDLTGLPPTPAEVAAFVKDASPDAYEKVVDRLLASPRYGERMASEWLDLARFADTHGYQMDRYRPMWPYRDWVIGAFNSNLAYDQFVTWQLAGDLLPNPTREQRLATAFNRLHMQNEEGGIVEEEYRVAYVNDRVDTFGTTFMGLTVNCAHCHDHKFDPITQKDFYSLFSIFQNVDEAGQTAYFNNLMPVPTMLLTTPQQDAELAQLQSKIAEKQKQLIDAEASLSVPFAEWLPIKCEQPGYPAGLVADFGFEKLEGGKIGNDADLTRPGLASDDPKLVPGKVGNGALLNGDNGFHFPGVGDFSRVDPFSLAIWIKTPTIDAPRMVIVHHSQAPADAGSRGYELLLEKGHVSFGLHHMWPGSSIKISTSQPIAANQWTHVAVTYDGSSKAAGLRLFVDGAVAPVDVIRDNLQKDITYYDGGSAELTIGYRFRDAGFKGGAVDEFKMFKRRLAAIEVADLAGKGDLTGAWQAPPAQLTAGQRAGLLEYYKLAISPELSPIAEELHTLRKKQSELLNPIPEIMVMQELSRPKKAYVLKRGQYDAHGDEVFADVPKFLPPFSPNEPRNRLGLSRWLFRQDNPLTSRVEVNRLWQQMFGKGIVETAENFGSQGSYPSHPELLDALAADFMQNGWDIKHLLRMIALSQTYRQSSRADEALLSRDPSNQLLARGPARRLTAEMLRDQALADSGLLSEKLGGPSVKPYQPEGLWDVAMGGPVYDQSHGDDLHRRTLYTFWKRTVPPPTLMTFDAADRSYCTARRQSTSTPLQALALLDDVQITEASRRVSERMLTEAPASLDARIDFVFSVLTGREASARQMEILRRLFTEQREIFAADPKAADKLLAVGEAPVNPGLNKLDLAAGTVMAEALFNSDETLMRR